LPVPAIPFSVLGSLTKGLSGARVEKFRMTAARAYIHIKFQMLLHIEQGTEEPPVRLLGLEFVFLKEAQIHGTPQALNFFSQRNSSLFILTAALLRIT
jgi:hypothetical protein